MVMEIASTTLSVFRGTAANPYGDLDDVGTLYLTGIPASVTETAKSSFDPASQTRRTIRAITAVVPSWADINDDDTLRDERTGDYLMIEAIQRQPTLGLPGGDTILSLRARSGVAIGDSG
jgi:hypothetical protein